MGSGIGLLLLLTARALLAAAGGWQAVGQIGGPTQGVAVQGSYAYVGVGLRLVVLDISNPAALREVGVTRPFPHFVQDVAVSGTLAYVAAGGAGLRVVDISNPAFPTEVGFWDSRGYAEGVAVAGKTAYLADGPYGLRVFDVSKPAQPAEIGSAYPMNYAFKVVVEGRYAYIAAAGAGLLIADISDPRSPVEIGSLDTSGYAYGVAVAGNIAYVADGWEGLKIVNVADPAHPYQVGSYKTPGWAFGLALSGAAAYVADAFGGLRVINVADAARPFEVLRHEATGTHAVSVAVTGSVALVADRNWGLRVVSLALPAPQPGMLGAIAYAASLLRVLTSGLPQVGFYRAVAYADGITVAGNYAYISAGHAGFHIVEVSDPENPRQVGVYDTDDTFATSAVVEGGRAYLVAIQGRKQDTPTGLHVLDISNPARPLRLGYFRTHAHDLALVGHIVYLADEGQLIAVDVSDPTAPKQIRSVPTPNNNFELRLVASGSRLYRLSTHLEVFELSGPSGPTLLGGLRVEASGPGGSGLAVSASRAYVPAGMRGLVVIDVSDPTRLRELAAYAQPGSATGITISGTTAYLANGPAGVEVADLSDPSSAVLGSCKTAGYAREVAVSRDTLYVADEGGGLVILRSTSAPPGSPPAPARGAEVPVAPPQPPIATLPPRPAPVRRDGPASTCTVVSSLDSGPGTLRECLQRVRNGDTITFDASVFSPNRPARILVESPLPNLQQGGLTIDASHAGVILDGSKAPPGTAGLRLHSDGNTIKGLQILSFHNGIETWSSCGNVIGGDRRKGRGPLGEGNLLSGNLRGGVWLDMFSNHNLITGNYIGTTLDGLAALGNDNGVFISGSIDNVIKGNLISGNGIGLVVTDWSPGFNALVGNSIGTDAAGRDLPHDGLGVMITSGVGFNRIGGTSPGEGNVLAKGGIVRFSAGAGNLVLGNSMSGAHLGVWVDDRASRAFVGGATDGERNLMSNAGSGVQAGTDYNFVAGNQITGAGGGGVRISQGEHNWVQGNLVTRGSGSGVEVDGWRWNTIRRNQIYANGGKGILANRGIAAPVITAVTATSVSGTACPGCEVEIFSDNEDEGRLFEGSAVAEASGVFAFTKRSPLVGPNVTATATDREGNTSEFSAAKAVPKPQ